MKPRDMTVGSLYAVKYKKEVACMRLAGVDTVRHSSNRSFGATYKEAHHFVHESGYAEAKIEATQEQDLVDVYALWEVYEPAVRAAAFLGLDRHPKFPLVADARWEVTPEQMVGIANRLEQAGVSF